MIKLGLIGQAIQQSRSPALHSMLGKIHGLELTYEMHIPDDGSPEAFRATLQRIRDEGYRGTNVTYPYKQVAIESAQILHPEVAHVGASNTLLLGEDIQAFNTDYTGFMKGYRARVGDQDAGSVLLVGAGGVGRAVAFALGELGATDVKVFDLNTAGAESLVNALQSVGIVASQVGKEGLAEAALQADGLVNCTPVGHYKTPGNPLDRALFVDQKWAFDAVYTPIDTEFMVAAHESGLAVVSGFDLFIHQGIDAFEHFTGEKVDEQGIKREFIRTFELKSNLLG